MLNFTNKKYDLIEKLGIKNISLQLYGKKIKIELVENSSSHVLFGKVFFQGTLIGRNWGDRLVNGKQEGTVIALVIRGDEGSEIEIPCKDIQAINSI